MSLGKVNGARCESQLCSETFCDFAKPSLQADMLTFFCINSMISLFFLIKYKCSMGNDLKIFRIVELDAVRGWLGKHSLMVQTN